MDQQLANLMAELFRMQESEISDSLTMKDTEMWDSLKHMELMFNFEQEFGIELQPEEMVIMVDFVSIKKALIAKGVTE